MSNHQSRKKPTRAPKKQVLIVCNGKMTEPSYFRKFKPGLVHVQFINASPLNLVKQAALYRNKREKQQGWNFDQCWCVFDKDDFTSQDFNQAVCTQDVRIAYSNEAFELWFLLHYDYVNTAISRHQYIKILNRKLDREYKKNDEAMFHVLRDKLDTAITNAKRLHDLYEKQTQPADRNPCTTVYKLVEILIKN
ncbi:MAG: RloB family protein [Candidatus Cloacimonetes bacterium]|nr:RloB family protein [Candidatus Cloacimonadota bacterium]